MLQKQIPPSLIGGKTYFADEEGNIINRKGHKLAVKFSPGNGLYRPNAHGAYPHVKLDKDRSIHSLVCAAFWGPAPADHVCHHLDGNKFNNRPANLLCWLTRAEHLEADRRQRALREAVDGGNLYGIPYERLRWLQDPRVTSREDFELELAKIREQGFHHYDLEKQLEYEMNHHCEC